MRRRIELIDLARGAALAAMAVYHFTWDLDFFGYIEPATSVTGGWRIFARSIATSFLFLVGFSLYLAHGDGMRLRPFGKRLAMIAAAAAAITLVTYFATPDGFIFFGILHNIAVATVIGVLFLRLPIALVVLAAAAAIAAPHFIQADFLEHPAFWWSGLSQNVRPSNDYIPLFPWLGVVLAGIAAAKLSAKTGIIVWLAAIQPPQATAIFSAAGRHSLAFYLLHQPILFTAVWLFAQAVPPAARDQGLLFQQACTAECTSQREENFCRAYCGCVLDAVVAENRLEALFNPNRDPDMQSWLQDVAFRCSVENNG